jgi:hypothetical protein
LWSDKFSGLRGSNAASKAAEIAAIGEAAFDDVANRTARHARPCVENAFHIDVTSIRSGFRQAATTSTPHNWSELYFLQAVDIDLHL